MICSNCNSDSPRVRYFPGVGERCPNCSEMSAIGKHRTDGITTRASFRVRTDAVKFEGDTIAPQAYDKVRRKVGPNPEFVRRYPNKVKEYFSNEQLQEANMPGVAKHMDRLRTEEKGHKETLRKTTEFQGDEKRGVEKAIKSVTEGK